MSDEKDFQIVKLHDEDKIEEELDLSSSIQRFVHTMRMVYLDHLCDDDDDELDSEIVRTSYQLAQELKYAIADCGEDMSLYLHLYLENVFDLDKPAHHDSWFELMCDDDMKVTALKLLVSTQYAVAQIMMVKMCDDLNVGSDDEKE